jgi:DhnA family fructose-bisphosphate aldolase class Ia
VAGGAPVSDDAQMLDTVRRSLEAGAAGVAFGRNVWGSQDPAGRVASLRELVHGPTSREGAHPPPSNVRLAE